MLATQQQFEFLVSSYPRTTQPTDYEIRCGLCRLTVESLKPTVTQQQLRARRLGSLRSLRSLRSPSRMRRENSLGAWGGRRVAQVAATCAPEDVARPRLPSPHGIAVPVGQLCLPGEISALAMKVPRTVGDPGRWHRGRPSWRRRRTEAVARAGDTGPRVIGRPGARWPGRGRRGRPWRCPGWKVLGRHRSLAEYLAERFAECFTECWRVHCCCQRCPLREPANARTPGCRQPLFVPRN